MRPLDLIPRRWLEYEPPSNCHDFGIGETIAALTASTAAEAGAGAAVAAGAAEGAAGLAGFGSTALAGASTASAFSLPSLSTLGTVASIGGTLLSAKAGSDQAAYQAAIDRANAAALKQKANEDVAAAQRAAITQQRRAELVGSRSRALAASSGASATDPTTINNELQIAEQGQYNALSALYEGQARGRSENYQADIDLFKASRTEAAAPWATGGTLLAGIANLADRRLMRNYYLSSAA